LASSMYSLPYHYLTRWGYNIVYFGRGKPVSSWNRYADEPMTVDVLRHMYLLARREWGGEPQRVAVATGPYQEGRRWHNIVVDIDEVGQHKEEVERMLSREGYVVVSTRRGLHVHAQIPASEGLYAVAVKDEQGEKVGEGAALQRHLWDSPPSKRPLAAGWYTYAFVLPGGRRLARYDPKALDGYDPPRVSLRDLESSIDAVLGYRLIRFRPRRRTGPEPSGDPVRHKPVFQDVEEFLARAPNLLLPTPVARILYNYYASVGAHPLANLVALRNPYLTRYIPLSPVPHGERFLAASEFALYVAHLTAWVRWGDLLEILAAGIEDWPDDDGMPLDRKLEYLFLFDETGTYVYPRYNGLGALRPLGHCPTCIYKSECDRRVPPWAPARKILRKLDIARRIRE